MTHHLRFGASFLLLGLLAAAALGGFVLGLSNTLNKASKSSVDGKASASSVAALTNPSRASAIKAACEANVKGAAASGVILTSCHLAPGKSSFQQKGDDARVVLITSDGQTKYTVVTNLSKGVWNSVGLQIIAQAPA